MREFDFLAPKSLNAALRAIGEKGLNYTLLAGGSNAIPDMRAGKTASGLLVDIGGIRSLKYIKEEAGTVRIGALATLAELLDSPIIRSRAPVLWEAARRFAGPLVRNRATVGGNLAEASPAADTAVPLLALKARVKLERLQASRTVGLDKFFTGYRKNALKPGEILTEVSFPIPPPETKQGYCKMGRRRAMAVSVVSVAALVRMDGKSCTDLSLALGAVAPTPLRALKAEAALRSRVASKGALRSCARAAAAEAQPIDDLRASAAYRRRICQVLVNRTLCQALGLEDESPAPAKEEIG
jgi:aerobic carbon-monoxide dehydrogenase medium subunit